MDKLPQSYLCKLRVVVANNVREMKLTGYASISTRERKFMEVLPADCGLPSCLHPLSEGVGHGLIQMLESCYCFIQDKAAHTLTFKLRPNIWSLCLSKIEAYVLLGLCFKV